MAKERTKQGRNKPSLVGNPMVRTTITINEEALQHGNKLVEITRRRSLSYLIETLIEAEWAKAQA